MLIISIDNNYMKTINQLFFVMLYETANVLRNQLDKRLKPLGLSQAKWRTLLYLSLAEKQLTQTELASRMGIEGATLVGLLDRLTRAGWVERKNSAEDRRTKIVSLTTKAKKTLDLIHDTAHKLRDEVLANITKQDLTIGLKVLQEIKSQAEMI